MKRLKWFSFSRVFTLSSPRINQVICPLCAILGWWESVLLYARRSDWLMGGRRSAELTIKGPAVTHNPITSRSTPKPGNGATTMARFRLVSLTGMYQLDRLASQKVFHQDPNILCNHRHCDIQRHARALVSGDGGARTPHSLPELWDFVVSFDPFILSNTFGFFLLLQEWSIDSPMTTWWRTQYSTQSPSLSPGNQIKQNCLRADRLPLATTAVNTPRDYNCRFIANVAVVFV